MKLSRILLIFHVKDRRLCLGDSNCTSMMWLMIHSSSMMWSIWSILKSTF